MRPASLLAALAALVGCSADRTSVLVLELSAEGDYAATRLTFQLGTVHRTVEGAFPRMEGAFLIGLTDLPASLGSPVLLDVKAFDASACLVAAASQMVALQPGEVTRASIVIRKLPVPDCAPPSPDGGAPPDAPASDTPALALPDGPGGGTFDIRPGDEALPDAPTDQRSADGGPGKLQNGAACATGGDCTSLFCVDNVCCDSACTGQCQACVRTKTTKADGTCAGVSAGDDPDGECASTPAASCGNDGACDGLGACRKHPSSVSCAAATCSGSGFTPERHCDGRGQCAPAVPASCGLFKCSPSGCPSTCAGDADCVTPYPCAGNTCGGKRANGAACVRTDECGSGFCVDGVCCGSACNGLCEACVLSKTGQADGTCQAVRTGEDPESECGVEAMSTCGNDGFCDGARACRKYAVSVVCMAASCSVSSFTPPRTCDGRGACAPGSGLSCGLARCTQSGCIATCTGDQDCVSGAICSNGSCVSPKPQGASCGMGRECASGHCVDSFCCNSDCVGSCQACSQAKTGGANGSCSGVKAGTDPDADCNAAEPTTCGNDGFCDGSGACRKYGTGTVCGQPFCSGNTANFTRGCDGQGACNPQMSRVCSSTEFCSIGSCLPKQPNGQTCNQQPERCVSGHCVDGNCCENACTTPCRGCGGGLCTTPVDRARDIGTCEGENWCLAGNCLWGIHWEDNVGSVITTYEAPFAVKVGEASSVFHHVAYGNAGIGTVSPSGTLAVSKTGEITLKMDNCTGLTMTTGGQRCVMDVWMTPQSPGTKQGVVTVTDGRPGHSVSLTYNYTAVP